MLAGITPIKLRLEEIIKLQSPNINNNNKRNEIKQQTYSQWQTQWNLYNGWTKTFIKDVMKWNNRKWGNLDYYITQGMTGHGTFGSYLHKIGKKQNAKCWFCNEIDTPEHTIFYCNQWTNDRLQAEIQLNQTIHKDNISNLLLHSEDYWNIITQMIRKILKSKQTYESNITNT